MKILVMEHPFQTVFLITKKKKQKLIFNYLLVDFMLVTQGLNTSLLVK